MLLAYDVIYFLIVKTQGAFKIGLQRYRVAQNGGCINEFTHTVKHAMMGSTPNEEVEDLLVVLMLMREHVVNIGRLFEISVINEAHDFLH